MCYRYIAFFSATVVRVEKRAELYACVPGYLSDACLDI